MISEQTKEQIKQINKLQHRNYDKKFRIWSTFYKEYTKKKQINTPNSIDNKSKNHILSLLRNKNISIFKKDERFSIINTNNNPFNPYVTMMMAKAANLTTYDNTKYAQQNKKKNLSSQNSTEKLTLYNNNQKTPIRKTFFGLDAKASLSDLDETLYSSIYKTKNNYQMKRINFAKTQYNSMKNIKEKNYSNEDDTLANNILFDENKNNKFLEKEQRNDFYNLYSINKQLTKEEKLEINKILNPPKNKKISKEDIYKTEIKTRSIESEYKSPFNSKKKLKINSQMCDAIEKIRLELQCQKYQDKFNSACELKIKKNKMPNIKVLSRKYIRDIGILKQDKTTSFFKKSRRSRRKVHHLLTKKIGNLNYDDYISKDNYEELLKMIKFSRYDKIKKLKIKLYYHNFIYHPESRTMSSSTFDDEKKIIYIYGGIAGEYMGDIWQCRFEKTQIFWERVFPLNIIKKTQYQIKQIPLPRFGHSMHLYKKKLYLIGGETKYWEKNRFNEPILWIFDINKSCWEYSNKEEDILLRNNDKINKKINPIDIKTLKKNKSEQKLSTNSSSNPNKLNKKIFKRNSISKKIPTITNKETTNTNEQKDNISTLAPCLRRNHTSILIGATIFIYGGLNTQKEYINDCWIYDIPTNKWSIVEFAGKYPPPLAHHCCCLALEKDQLINDTFTIYQTPSNNRKTFPLLKIDGLFFFGGINNNKCATNLLFHMSVGSKPVIFDIPKTNGIPPSPRIDASMNFAQGTDMIIIHGGKNDSIYPSVYNDIFLLDLETLDWIKPSFKGLPPIERSQHLTEIIGDDLIIFGGTSENELLNFDFTIVELDFFQR